MLGTSLKGQFAQRLIHVLKCRGYLSDRSAEGVATRPILDCLGCTRAMARRYLTGLAIPDHLALLKLAKYLNANPGWLLFGEHDTRGLQLTSQTIHLPIVIIEHLLNALQQHTAQTGHELPTSFLINLMSDLSQMQADRKTLT